MKDQTTKIEARIPAATYRLQFNSQFTFKQAAGLADYLYDLGVSDCYASPLLTARRDTSHGYDIIDHSNLNPEIGSEEEFAEFARRLGRRGMGLILDVAPNHMSIAGSSNRWWNDVLENGPSSPYAQFFDIDWQPPPKPDLAGKTLLPMLGDQFGRALENQEITISYRQGAFFANYYETWLPIAPRSYTQILEPVLPEVEAVYGEHHPHVGNTPNFADLIYKCKKLILRVAMSSESHVLARRLDRISEIPAKWRRAVCRWRDINRDRKTWLEGEEILDSNAEFQTPIARAGMYNSLAQTLFKVTAPGVPDFYQGSELWDFNLVAPDNHRWRCWRA